VLEVQDLRFAYPGEEATLSGVTFSLPPKKKLAIVGENGSGKTTLARLMCGLLEPSGGVVTVDALDTRDAATIYEVRRKVGIVFQDPDDQIVETTVEREIGFGPRNLGLSPDQVDQRVDRALVRFGIAHLRTRSCHLLSAGEKQILAVASVSVMEPDYIILDEATSLVDAMSRRALVSAIERLLGETGAGLVFISMRLEDIWICDEVLFLKDGLVAFRGTKDGFLKYLVDHRYPLSGSALLLSKLEMGIPGFTAALAEFDSLSADTLASVLSALRGTPGRDSERGSAGDDASDSKGGSGWQ
jgi:energy-coupling factor transport system ATP-binding protein